MRQMFFVTSDLIVYRRHIGSHEGLEYGRVLRCVYDNYVCTSVDVMDEHLERHHSGQIYTYNVQRYEGIKEKKDVMYTAMTCAMCDGVNPTFWTIVEGKARCRGCNMDVINHPYFLDMHADVCKSGPFPKRTCICNRKCITCGVEGVVFMLNECTKCEEMKEI